MTRAKRVVRAFGSPAETAQPADLPDGPERFPPPGQYLVGVALVPHIPYDLVRR